MMTTEQQDGAATNGKKRRGPKTYPTRPFEEVLILAKTIHDEGVSGRLRRLTLFDRLGRSPDSGPSRQLVTTSSRYGLTEGGYQAETLELTETGRAIAAETPNLGATREMVFDCAIGKFTPFQGLYEKLRNQRIPANDVLLTELRQLGIEDADCQDAAGIFVANARYVGLIQQRSGSERLLPIEQVLEETGHLVQESQDSASAPPQAQEVPVMNPTLDQREASEPSLHIDVQVHIDSTATSEQIDQIFASMAKHLYGRDG